MYRNAEDIVYSPAVIEFVAVANEFCSFIEQAGGFNRADFVDKSRKILPLLYYKAVLLPDAEPLLEENAERFVTEVEWDFIHDTLLNRLGRFNDYPESFDPVLKDTDDLVGGSIAENIADIYQDIKDFVMRYQIGTVELMNDAIWDCMQYFDQSWGQKLLNSLKALHDLIHSGELVDEEEEESKNENARNTAKNTDNWIITQRQNLWNEEYD